MAGHYAPGGLVVFDLPGAKVVCGNSYCLFHAGTKKNWGSGITTFILLVSGAFDAENIRHIGLVHFQDLP